MNISISVTIYTPWFIPKYHPATQDEGDAESGIQVSKYNIEKLGSPSYGAAAWKGTNLQTTISLWYSAIHHSGGRVTRA